MLRMAGDFMAADLRTMNVKPSLLTRRVVGEVDMVMWAAVVVELELSWRRVEQWWGVGGARDWVHERKLERRVMEPCAAASKFLSDGREDADDDVGTRIIAHDDYTR